MSRYILSFVIGVTFGALLMQAIDKPSQNTEKNSTQLISSEEVGGTSLAPLLEPPVEINPTQTTVAISSAPTIFSPVDTSPTIPVFYKQIIGPAVRHLSFGEKYEMFEAEPIDVPWAQAMETGISNYVAQLGPETGSVFDFIQCRSSGCVLAGYSLEGHEAQSASIIGEMRRESWWLGGNSSYSHGGGDDQNTFVIMLSRD